MQRLRLGSDNEIIHAGFWKHEARETDREFKRNDSVKPGPMECVFERPQMWLRDKLSVLIFDSNRKLESPNGIFKLRIKEHLGHGVSEILRRKRDGMERLDQRD